MKTYFVIAKETCPTCDGNRVITPVDLSGDVMDPCECPDCHGEGIVKGEVTLEEAIMEQSASSLKLIANS